MLFKWVVLLDVITKGTGNIPGITAIHLAGSSPKKRTNWYPTCFWTPGSIPAQHWLPLSDKAQSPTSWSIRLDLFIVLDFLFPFFQTPPQFSSTNLAINSSYLAMAAAAVDENQGGERQCQRQASCENIHSHGVTDHRLWWFKTSFISANKS